MGKIGDRIAYLRKARGLSQTELAKAVGASREAIGKYERNEAMPSVETARRIASVFGVTLDHLVDEGATASFDGQMVKRLNRIQELDEKDREHLFALMDAFLRDAGARKAYSS